jgi:hypothetical protein
MKKRFFTQPIRPGSDMIRNTAQLAFEIEPTGKSWVWNGDLLLVPVNEGRRAVFSKDGRRRLRFWSEGVGLLDCRDSVSNDDLCRMNGIAGGRVYIICRRSII